MAHRLFLFCIFSFLAWSGRLAAETSSVKGAPWERPSIDLESGLVWQVGNNTPLSYRLVPTQLSWRSREAFGWDLPQGLRLRVRHRLTCMATWISQGPESHYIAVAGSPSLEVWDQSGTWGLIGGAGGGFGLIDSRGVKGGQGQDFTLHWFARAGVERVVSRNGDRLSVGILFQHMSNGGQTDPNPGIDAVGLTLGFSRPY
ncbi:MAG TPA: acyloxyacyl hydrolase [Opitutaceae bacterium]|nr:acyloxyacyl hydrolase [Opitutaceae bacterium]